MNNRKLKSNEFEAIKQPWILAIAPLLIILLLVSGHFYGNRAFNSARSSKTKELELEGMSKLNQIKTWLSDEIFDASSIANNETVHQYAEKWSLSKSTTDSIELAKLVTSYAVEQGYFTIFLVTGNGKLLLSSNELNPEIDPVLEAKIKEGLNSDSTLTTDFYRSGLTKHIWIDFLVKRKSSQGSPAQIWVFRFDPVISLFPMIIYGPKSTGIIDTYVGRLEGTEVQILNDMGTSDNGAANFTYTLKPKDAELVSTAKGHSGVLQAIDFQGKEVLACINMIPQTQWLIITKTNISEVYREVYLELGFLVLITLLSILLILTGAILLYRKLSLDSYKKLFKANEEFRTVVQNINAIVFILDVNSIFEMAEGLGLRTLELTSEGMVGHSAKMLYQNCPEVLAGIDKVLAGESNKVEWLVEGKYFDILLTPRLDSEGKVNGAIGLATNITEHFTAAEALKQREIWFRRLANTTSTAIFIYQGETFVYVNRTCTNLTGYTEAELVGMNFWEIVHPESKELIRERGFARMRGEKVPNRYEFRIIQKNGIETWVDFTAGEIDWEGQPAGIGTAIDITRHKKSEIIQKIQYNIADAAVRSRNLEELFAIIRTELSTIVEITNCFYVHYQKLTGLLTLPFEKLESFGDLQARAIAESLARLLIHKRQTLLLRSTEIQNLAPKDDKRIYDNGADSWLGVPIFIHDEAVGAVVLQTYSKPETLDPLCGEILEIIANQLSVYIERNEIEETAFKLAKCIEQSPVSIIITNIDGTIEYVNPMFSKTTGYSRNEAIGENPRILKSGKQSVEFYTDLWDNILSGNDWHGEFHNRKKNGDFFWENGIIAPIINESGKITHFIAVMEDISDRRKMIEDLILAKDHAEESDRLKSAFLANMSHEIRTPMNAIIGFSELLNDPETTPSERNFYTRTIQQRSLDLLGIINDILDLSFLESGQLKTFEEPGSISVFLSDLEQVAFSIRNDLTKSDILFTVEIEEQLAKIQIVADWRRLRQVLTNLINNAFKFTITGFIQVSCELRQDGFLGFKVSDSGIGIPQEKLKAVFERFVQAEDALTRKHGGAGLGLPICKGLIELMGGEISLESYPDKGSTFYFSIPFHQID